MPITQRTVSVIQVVAGGLQMVIACILLYMVSGIRRREMEMRQLHREKLDNLQRVMDNFAADSASLIASVRRGLDEPDKGDTPPNPPTVQ